MKEFNQWVVGNNGVDVHENTADFDEVATFFDKEKAKLAQAAPEMYNFLRSLLERNDIDREDKANIQVILNRINR